MTLWRPPTDTPSVLRRSPHSGLSLKLGTGNKRIGNGEWENGNIQGSK